MKTIRNDDGSPVTRLHQSVEISETQPRQTGENEPVIVRMLLENEIPETVTQVLGCESPEVVKVPARLRATAS